MNEKGNIAKLKSDFRNLDFNNEDEKRTIDANFISAYKRQLVLKKSFGRSGSFGGIMSLNKKDKNPDIVKHESGHFLQFKELGFLKYYLGIGLPSFLNGKANNYYDQPWEVTADMYSRASRNNSSDAIERGKSYLDYLKSVRGIKSWVNFIKSLPKIIKNDMSVLKK